MVDIVSKLFIVELRTKGWAVSVSHTPEERVLTTFFRLSREQKNKLQYLKVAFYRVLDKYKVFELGGKYIVHFNSLITIEQKFREIYEEFLKLRDDFYNNLVQKWSEIYPKLVKEAKKIGIPEAKLKRLKPETEEFMEMYYTITPLPDILNNIYKSHEQFLRLAKEKEEYRALAERIRQESERMISDIKEQYERKIKQLENLAEKYKKALKEKERKLYKARIQVLAEEAKDVAELLGDETLDDLKYKLDVLKEAFTS